jgi:hypothetical protein
MVNETPGLLRTYTPVFVAGDKFSFAAQMRGTADTRPASGYRRTRTETYRHIIIIWIDANASIRKNLSEVKGLLGPSDET